MKTGIILLSLTILVFSGCATIEEAPQETTQEHSLEDLYSIFASMNTPINTPIKSLSSGRIMSDYHELPEGFNEPVVVKVSSDYYYDNRILTSEYELIYLSVLSNSNPGDITRDEIIGYSTNPTVSIIARSETIDRYLVSVSAAKPVFYRNYWYYMPGMYIPSEMKWLSFRQADYNEFKAMYDHAVNEEEFYGLTIINWWILYETRLTEYPVPKTTSGRPAYEQLIYFEDIPLRLTYQEGFLRYLEEEYTLGDTIFLYLQIGSINAFTKEYDCYVRDFSLISPKEIIDTRMDFLTSLK